MICIYIYIYDMYKYSIYMLCSSYHHTHLIHIQHMQVLWATFDMKIHAFLDFSGTYFGRVEIIQPQRGGLPTRPTSCVYMYIFTPRDAKFHHICYVYCR